jgi:hypothetical protein
MQFDFRFITDIIRGFWKYSRKRWFLTTKERSIIALAQSHPNELYILSVDTIPEFVRIGTKNLGREDDPQEITQYVEAFRSLESMGFIQHLQNRLYKLTARGYRRK